MLENFMLHTYLYIYQLYNSIWSTIFNKIGQILLLYYFNGNNLENITWNYYSGKNIDKYKKGVYFCQVYNEYGANYLSFKGDLSNLENFKQVKNIKYPKRKNILLMNNDRPVEIDLHIFDNYRANIDEVPDSPETELATIAKFFGIDCTHVKFIEIIPFRQKLVPINELNINDIYY